MPLRKSAEVLKVVLDTNILVSSRINKKGASWKIFDQARANKIKILTSNFQLSEFGRVLSYPRIKKKYRLRQRDIKRTVLLLKRVTSVLNPQEIPDIIKTDPDDNHILAIAKEGKADIIISGDHHLLDLEKYKKIPIMTAKKYSQKVDQLWKDLQHLAKKGKKKINLTEELRKDRNR